MIKLATFILWAFTVNSQAMAGEAAFGARSASGSSSSGLPRCVDDPARVASIANDEQTSFIKTGTGKKQLRPKYGAFQNALSTDSDEELIARLVYSETVAANCPNLNDKLVDPIAAVVANRVAAKGTARSVVFEKDQFASSLNIYGESRYKDFLCPKNSDLWAKAVKAARKAKLSPVSSAKGYYLFQHFADKPDVLKKYNSQFESTHNNPVSFAGSEQVKTCLRLYPN